MSRIYQEDHIPETVGSGLGSLHNNNWWDGHDGRAVTDHNRRARGGMAGSGRWSGRVVGGWYPS